ncbi:hypothetical protein RAC89_17710 [Paenibacillus sp. GD4]|uniref:hypothetical protein n=1 Tax=Paenibacillus sp. GD4 TaxID=3068890 RepID=UPI0027967DBA|nr:hypothetical protein [Paenibacillus sp. GD4]MDQ1912227.1 hypothetical protein [Paenibacillus sp. GD4]
MRKKAAMVLVLFMAASAVWITARDRYLAEHRQSITETVDQVYTAFIAKNYDRLAELSASGSPNHMQHIRSSYGEIQSYELLGLRTKSTREGERVEAEIRVVSFSDGKLHTGTDRLMLVSVDGQWKTWEYASELKLALPAP